MPTWEITTACALLKNNFVSHIFMLLKLAGALTYDCSLECVIILNFPNIIFCQILSIIYPLLVRVSNYVTWFLKQFEARNIEAMSIGNLLTKIKQGSSSMLAVLATI